MANSSFPGAAFMFAGMQVARIELVNPNIVERDSEGIPQISRIEFVNPNLVSSLGSERAQSGRTEPVNPGFVSHSSERAQHVGGNGSVNSSLASHNSERESKGVHINDNRAPVNTNTGAKAALPERKKKWTKRGKRGKRPNRQRQRKIPEQEADAASVGTRNETAARMDNGVPAYQFALDAMQSGATSSLSTSARSSASPDETSKTAVLNAAENWQVNNSTPFPGYYLRKHA
ncbi:hypothetical protein BU24DRAFT_403518 [Aaosphaeria arxii CBS 175.79]|uniref:Uncharacterized protein n=1 Tax=Aaosphaeria arxii CBS 175.79 TaxID=1450172 RepID=A0A6A5Y5B2_9PLEO|nr:uncharacterized protein BU24DRAFT_403518 [Aaosphaeria arxii CBS 175.79]KAF2020403.1 hypothetical protein BU24DRAFT_403518 [Aaosphaeria arxii CBS 175.79]